MKRFVKVISVMLVLTCVFASAAACGPQNYDTTVGQELEKVGKVTSIGVQTSAFASSIPHVTDSAKINAALDELKKIPLARMEKFNEKDLYPDADLTCLHLCDEERGNYLGYSLALHTDGTVYLIHKTISEENSPSIAEVFRSEPNAVDTNQFLTNID